MAGSERNQKHTPGEFGFIQEVSRGFLKEKEIYMCVLGVLRILICPWFTNRMEIGKTLGRKK